MQDPHALRDAAHVALMAAITEGDEDVCDVAWAWAHAFDDANVAGLRGTAEILRWSDDEVAQVLAALAEAFLAGPAVADAVLRAVVGLSPPNRGALTRPLTIRQLVSSAWTAALGSRSESGSAGAWWTTPAGRAVAAAMAEACCTMHPYDDVGLSAALAEVPATPGSARLEEVLADLGLTDLDAAADPDRVLSFVLRAGPSPAGVTWWPAPPEHVVGHPRPLPEVPAAVAAALGVPPVDVYDDEDFCPAPLLPIGHGRRALPDLEVLDAIARDRGIEVLSVIGTLSAEGIQLVVRTTGPAALFATQPGVVNLVGDQSAR